MIRCLLAIPATLLGLLAVLPAAGGDGLPRGDARAGGFRPATLARLGALLNDAMARRQAAITTSGPDPSREEYTLFARSARGDAARGRALFVDPKRLACARCHRVRGEGAEIGPDLSDVGGKFSRDLLIESVLDPSRQIVEGYRPAVVATADGRVLTGVVKQESAGELTLVDVEGRRQVVRKSEIAQRKISDASIMPAGLAAGASRQDFADLIAYLETLRSAGQGTPGAGDHGPVTLPPGFTRETVVKGLTGATAMEVAPDGRVFVCEQTGALRVIKGGALLAEPFVTLEVDSHWERGLIGVALDPDFARNGFVYLNSVSPRRYPHHRISRFTAAGDVAARGSEIVLFEGDDQTRLGGSRPDGHQGGALHFGIDGKLYVALGDQTAGEPAQRLDTLQGKLLRLNPDGSIPKDNPFYRAAREKYRSIWALGLRNPFSFAVQPGTGRIFINDVGEARWEEVDEGFAGANYGWPAAEGPTADRRFRGPIHHYPVASVAGGAFCPTDRQPGFPPRFRGKYFFMDFVQGWIKVLDPKHTERVETFATGLTRPVDLKFAPDGSLYVLLRDAWVVDENFRAGTGSLLRIRTQPAVGGQPEAPAVLGLGGYGQGVSADSSWQQRQRSEINASGTVIVRPSRTATLNVSFVNLTSIAGPAATPEHREQP